MRLNGAGYKTIAAALGGRVRRDNVRYFCKSHGLIGAKELIKLNFDVHRDNPIFCKQCGLRLIRNRHSGLKLFCSDKCRREWWKANPNDAAQTHKKVYNLTCEYCHIKYISFGKSDRKYCSHDCYIKARFWSDPEVPVTAIEIEKRQKMKSIEKKETTVKLKRIS